MIFLIKGVVQKSDYHFMRSGRPLMKRILSLLCASAVVGSGLMVGASTASAAPTASASEGQFLTLLNTERTNAGLAPVVSDPLIYPVAHDWSVSLANSQVLSHRPDLVASFDNRVTKSWTRIGENVGRGPDVVGLHNAFMNSPGHKANVLGDYNRIAVAVVIDSAGTIWVTFNFMKATPISGPTGLVGSTPGAVFDAAALGPVTTAAMWMTTPEGNVLGFGGAPLFGNLTSLRLNRPIVGMTPTIDHKGYWMDASDGGIFAFGDAGFYGSTGAMLLNQPIVGMATTPSGHGYWLVASDGGFFAFGDAGFFGSAGAMILTSPVFAMGASPSGHGYWLVTANGAIFAFGDAGYYGSTAGQALTAPIARMIPTANGNGYRLIGQDGRVYSFGDAGSGSSGVVPGLTAVVSAASAA